LDHFWDNLSASAPRIRLIMVTILILAASLSLHAGQVPLTAEFAFPDIPHAAVVGTEGVVLNPAALYINKPIGIQFYHGFAEGDLSGDNAFLISTAGVGFAYQRLGLGYRAAVSRYDFAISSRVVRNIYTGTSYTYYKTDWDKLDKAHSWNYSIMWHVRRQFSASLQFQNLNRHTFGGEKTSVGYLLSAAFRPLGERLTIGANARLYGGQRLSEAEWRLSGRAYLKPGLLVYAGFGDKQRFGIGLEFHFGQAYGGSEVFFDKSGGYSRTTIYGGTSSATRESLIRGPRKILHVNLAGDIPEERSRKLLFGKSKETLYRTLAKIRSACNDPAIIGFLLTLKSPRLGWGKLSDFRREIVHFSESGKPVICCLGASPGTGSYYLASAADSIFMLPVDALYLIGLSAEVKFFAGTLDKLAIEPQIEKIGKYKNAPNLLTETSLTPEHREALEVLLDDIYGEVIGRTAVSRGITPSELESLVDRGPFTSIEAESLRLVDGRFYPGELTERLPEMFGGDWQLLPVNRFLNQPRYREGFGQRPRIALITVAGSITKGRSGSNPLTGKTAGSATLSAAIRQAGDDPAVRAIVVRLDTPGGDAIASDLIWGELVRARKKKPVIVSMSDVCASGGYYIASAADEIFVEPATVTGSIGVFAGKANLAGFYDKLGISTERIKRGKHAGMFSSSSPFSEEERALLRRHIGDLYNNFISIVANGRRLSVDSVDAIAQGRVWSGQRALQLGLADREGSLLAAIAAAAERADLREGEYEIEELPVQSWWPGLGNLLLSGISDLFADNFTSLIGDHSLLLFGEDNSLAQYRLPYSLRIE
ncbi:MAG: signal peptide peptidase SppA, partial [candidate division Zixibacteria bacterium]|nr:signal peptide peptidase SppA [candidate division Zixibacteria bacterium]